MANSGELGDILSLALQQTGVGALNPPRLSLDNPSSILNEAADTIDDSLLSSDIGSLTQGLLSNLARPTSSKPATALHHGLVRQGGSGTGMSNRVDGLPVGNLIDISSFPEIANGSFGGGLGPEENGPVDLSALEENIDLDELLSGVDPMPPVSLATSGESTSGMAELDPAAMLFPPPSTAPNPLSNGADSDDISSLLDVTGAEYLESLSREPSSLTPLPSYGPPSSGNGGSNVRQFSYGATYPNSSRGFGVGTVPQQLTHSRSSVYQRSNSLATPFMAPGSLSPRGSAMGMVRGPQMQRVAVRYMYV